MRAKHVWTYLPLPAYAKTFWERITFSRLTIIYLAFSLIHFFIQLALQIRVFTINANAFNSAVSMIEKGDAGRIAAEGLPLYRNSTLVLCKWVPSDLNINVDTCEVIWPRANTSSQQDNLPPFAFGSPSTIRLEQTSTARASSQVLKAPQSATASSSLPSVSAVLTATSTRIAVPTAKGPGSIALASVPATPTAGSSPRSSSTRLANTPSPIITPATASPIPPTVTVVVVPSGQTTFTRTVIPTVPTALNNAGTADAPTLDDEDEEEEHEHDTVQSSDGDGDDDDVKKVLRLLSRQDESEDATDTQVSGIPPVCLDALKYPLSILGNTKREDIVFVGFQFWVLGMSVVALLNESIPHIFASLVTHIMATAWGGFQLVHTANFRREFNTIITKGACQGVQGLPITPAYWASRSAVEIPILALNVLALLISCLLTWKLIKLFGWQTFKRVGASLIINRMYKLVLTMSITLQLSLFFMAVTVSLWIDSLLNGVIGDLAVGKTIYLAVSVLTLVLLIPWLMTGWFGVRRELKPPMLVFLGFCLVYLGGWSAMFISTTFRWTFISWRFFSIMASASVLLTVASLILGILCRMNFGKGLLRYLSAQETLSGDDFGIVTPDHDIEKVDFPSTEKPMPTFDAAYGGEATAGGRLFISNGPRFFNNQAPGMVAPPPALTRAPSDASDKSASSMDSYYSYSHSRDNSIQGHSKRWVIE